MAKFKAGDKALIVIGTYPSNYRGVKFEPEPELVGTQVIVTDGGQPYVNEIYVTDYSISDEAGSSLGLIDEVHLQLVAEPVVKLPEPDQYVVDSVLALHAFEILERIEAKLKELDQRLAAHEARAAQVTSVVINVTGQTAQEEENPDPGSERKGAWGTGYEALQKFKKGTHIEVEYASGEREEFIVYETDEEFYAPDLGNSATDLPLCLIPVGQDEEDADWYFSEGIVRARRVIF